MKNSVILKSFSSGISVILDSTIPYEELLLDVAAKFHDADHFFKNASVAISLEGRELTEKQEREILDTITQNSHLNVLCLMGKDEEKASLGRCNRGDYTGGGHAGAGPSGGDPVPGGLSPNGFPPRQHPVRGEYLHRGRVRPACLRPVPG